MIAILIFFFVIISVISAAIQYVLNKKCHKFFQFNHFWLPSFFASAAGYAMLYIGSLITIQSSFFSSNANFNLDLLILLLVSFIPPYTVAYYIFNNITQKKMRSAFLLACAVVVPIALYGTLVLSNIAYF